MSEMWDSVAPNWEREAEFVDQHMAPATERLLDEAAVKTGMRVLELAGGPGGAGLLAADRVGPSGAVLVTDSAPEMVRVAARRAAGTPGVDTAVCEQDATGLEDASFDAVVVRHGLMFSEEPVAAVREAARVLRGGGRYAAMTWAGRDENEWLGLLLDAVGEQFGVPFPPPHIPGPFALSDQDLLAATLREGGLEDVRVVTVQTPMSSPALEEWWERVPRLAGPLATALAGMEPDVRDQIAQRALVSAREAATPVAGGFELRGAVRIASGAAA